MVTSESLSNAGAVYIGSGGALNLFGNGTFSQTAGTTTLNGALTAPTVNFSGGTVSGSGGTITGNVTKEQRRDASARFRLRRGHAQHRRKFHPDLNGTFLENLSGTGNGQFSILNVTSGKTALGGTLNVEALSGFTPANAQILTFIDSSGAVSGQFSTLKYAGYSESGSNILSIGNNLDLEVLYNTNNVELEVLAQSGAGSDNWAGGSGSWNTPSGTPNNSNNWTTGSIPTSTQSVTLGTGAGKRSPITTPATPSPVLASKAAATVRTGWISRQALSRSQTASPSRRPIRSMWLGAPLR